MGNTVLPDQTYAEHLFDFPAIGPLEASDAANAIVKPARDEGVDVHEDAVALIVQYTKGYPYFLQEWGKHAWDVADTSPITRQAVETASREALAALDDSFFRVRFDRLTPTEKNICARWQSWAVGRIAPATSPHNYAGIVPHSVRYAAA